MLAKIILPWPPSAMSPNGAHGHWSAKSSAAKAHKLACWAMCKAQGVRPVEADAVDVSLIFYPPSRRAYDLDNALARIKQGLDAVAEAIGVDDSRWQAMHLERGERCKDGGVIVLIHEVTA